MVDPSNLQKARALADYSWTYSENERRRQKLRDQGEDQMDSMTTSVLTSEELSLLRQELRDQGEDQMEPTSTSVPTSEELSLLRPEPRHQVEKQMEPTITSMLTLEELMLEMLVRQEIMCHPNSKVLRVLYEGLKRIQYARGQEAQDSKPESKDLISPPPKNLLVVSSKEMGTFDISGIKDIEHNDFLILHELRRSFFEVEKWRKSSFTSTGPFVHPGIFPRDSLMAKFIPLNDMSLLSIDERTQEMILRKRIAQSPVDEALHSQYNQIRDRQRQRESVRDNTESDIVIKTLQTDLWAIEVDASPLSRRAWTLQARLLSTRVLHFTQSQLFWECESSKACETWPQPELKRTSQTGFAAEISYRKPKAKRPLDGVTLTPLDKHWEEIVELYTDANLTREEDKLVAISSLAKEIQQKTKDQYYAGLWRDTFFKDLLFRVELPQKPTKIKYRAPSWSWASINGKVNFICKNAREITPASNIMSIWTIGQDGKRASTGQIQDGSFTISAPTCQILRQEKRATNYQLIFSDEMTQCDTSAQYFPDTRIDLFPREAICLPLIYYRESVTGVENGRDSYLAGLVLLPTGEFRGEFQRFGVFRMRDVGGRFLFEEGQWRGVTVV